MGVFSLVWLTDHLIAVLCVLAGVLILSSYIPRWLMSLKYRRLPPGPFCWPLIGFVPAFSVEAIVDRLQDLSVKFGGIFGFHVGSRYVLFIDDFQALKTAFNREEFLGRTPRVLNLSSDKLKKGIGDMNGPEWKEMKRFWQTSIRTHGVTSQNFREAIMSQISLLTKELENKVKEDVDVHHLLEHPFFNLGSFFAYGKTHKRGHRIIHLLHEYRRFVSIILGINLLKYMFPWFGKALSLLPTSLWSKKATEDLETALSKEVRDHRRTLDPNDPRDFVDLFLLQMEKPGMELFFNEKSILVSIVEMITGITTGPCLILEWFLLSMAAYPDIQAAIQEKVDSTVGGEREPLLTDKPLLPLLDAAIMESMRYRYIASFLGFRSVQKDTTLNGYDIPKDALVFYNAAFHFRNPKYWPEPDRFNPDRFLSPNGSSLQIPEHFIAYGVGKRTSLGESTTGPLVFLLAASLLQRFRILPPDGGINLDINYSIANKPVHPFVKFQKRL